METKNKKGIMIGAIILFFLAALAIILGVAGSARGYGYGGMMRGANVYPSVNQQGSNQFTLPQDALKSGEIALTVDNLENAKKNVADVASQNDGQVYASYIEYASNSVRNGSVVVQVPVEKFDQVFEDLKKAGNQVVQESTQQVEKRMVYPAVAVPQAQTDETGDQASKADSKASQGSSEAPGGVSSSNTTYPQPQEIAQDKGYIRVIFVDYGAKKTSGFGSMMGAGIGNMMGGAFIDSNYQGQNLRNDLGVVLAIKVVLLIVLIGLLIFILKKTFGHYHAHRKARHEVKQMTKRRTRVTKTAARRK